MKLYTPGSMSANCRRVHATIKHLGLEVETVEASPMDGGLNTPEFMAINPNKKIPALVDGDLALWESRTICQYLASQKPSSNFWPEDAKSRANIERWMMWDGIHFGSATANFAYENFFKKAFMNQEPDATRVEWAKENFHQYAPVLNAQLETTPWVAGEHLTLADFSIGASLQYAEQSKLPWEQYSFIQKWSKQLAEVPAWKSTMPQMG